MEIGGSHDEMVFDSFDQVEQSIDHLHLVIEKRKMMTGSEKQKLKALKEKVHFYPAVEKSRRDSVCKKINYLLKTYYSYYNG